MEVDSTLILHLIKQVDQLHQKLDAIGSVPTEHEWLSAEEFCKLAGISPEALKYAVRTRKIHSEALRNTGTVKKMRLRYHRKLALDQFLKGVPAA